LSRLAARASWLTAPGLPVFTAAAVLMQERARSLQGADTLFIESAVAIVAAPIYGVAVLTRRSRTTDLAPSGLLLERSSVSGASAAAWRLAAGAALFAITSAILALTVFGGRIELVAASHATLWVATVTLTALGAFFASACTDPLDAAAAAVGASVVMAASVFVLGSVIAEAPTGAIDIALLASPIVSIASAANLDIFRSDVLYRLSPIAHISVNYPPWQAAFEWYALVALACFLATAVNLKKRRRTLPIERN
jgi:hypothetical protein